MNILQVRSGLYQTNTYIIDFEQFVVLVDPSDDFSLIKEKIQNKELYGILITHGHFDHISSLNALLNKYPNVTLFLHSNALEKLSDATLNASYMTRKPFVVSFSQTHVIEVAEGSIITLPNQSIIQVLYTPGHTNCGVCYLLDQHIFVGDTIFKDYIGAYHFKTGNIKELRLSCKRIVDQLGNLTCYPGHYDIVTTNYIKHHNTEYMKLTKDLT